MLRSLRHPPRLAQPWCAAVALGALVVSGAVLGGPAGAAPSRASAAQAATPAPAPGGGPSIPKPTTPPAPKPSRQPVTTRGTLVQLSGAAGCLVNRSARAGGCTTVRALGGPGPFRGSRAIAIDPAGRHVYVASSRSNAITIFRRSGRAGALRQARGAGGCVAADGAGGCATAVGLSGPSSVAVSPDGRSVYAASVKSSTLTVFARDSRTGALTQLRGEAGCHAHGARSGCAAGRALDGANVVVVSPDGAHVYVGAFDSGTVAVFARHAQDRSLTQPAGPGGCLGGRPADGCAPGRALSGAEGLAISDDGRGVYVAAAESNALAILARDASTGALTQATDGTGCIAQGSLAGCTPGVGLTGAGAVAVSPDGTSVHVTGVEGDTVTTYARTPSTGALTQPAGTAGCVVFLLANGCSLGRALDAPEGVTVSPDGGEVYVAAFGSGAVGTYDRNASTGALLQKPRRPGCLLIRAASDCTRGQALAGLSSVVVSPDGRNLYGTAFKSDAVVALRRITRGS